MSTVSPVFSREWWFGSIPTEWCTLPLKYLCSRSSLYGANVEASVYENDGIRFLRTTDIRDDGTLNEGGVSVPADMVVDYMLSEGDFLISRSGTVGRAYVYRPEDGTCAYAGYLIRYALRDPESPRWLFYITKSPGFQQWLGTATIEATIGNVNGEKYANLLVPVPPPAQRRAIADYLDRETARLDALVAVKERLLDLLAEKRRTLITQAVTRGIDSNVPLRDSGIPWLGEIPAHWKVVQLKFTSESLQTGPFGSQLHSEDYVTGGTPVVNPSHLACGRIHASEGVSVDEITADRLAVHRLNLGDIVFARRGEMGRCGVVEAENVGWLCGTGSLRARLRKNSAVPYYLALVFAETRISDMLAVQSVGSTMNNLNTEILGGCHVPMPPLEEQHVIVDYVDREAIRLDAIRSKTGRTIVLLKERRAVLISAAVTGRIDVKEET